MESPVGEGRTAEPSGRGPTLWATLLVVGAIALTIGPPVVGIGVFHASDLLLDHPPWSSIAGDGEPVNPLLGDTVNNEVPVHAAYRERIFAGDFPLWLPEPSGGRPLGAITDGAALGPLALPYLVVPLWFAPALSKLLEMAVAAGFTFLFLRRLSLTRVASLVGGLVYMTSGFQVVWSNWPQPRVGAWIPALFWALERGIQRRDVLGFLPVPLIIAALFFEGFPSVALYGILAAAVYVAVRVFLGPGLMRQRARSLLLPAAAVLIGVGLAALQLLPLAERLGHLDLGYREQNPEAHLPAVTAATLAVPNALGSPTDETYFGPLNYVEVQSFIGVAALLLVGAAVTGRHRLNLPRGTRGFLWGGSIVGGLLLYVGGPFLAVAQTVWLFRMNPIGRVRSVFGLFLACLAAVGMEALMRRREGEPGRSGQVAIVVAAGAATALLIGWRVLTHAEAAGRIGYVLAAAAVPAGALIVGVVILAVTRRRPFHGAGLAALVVPSLLVLESAAFVLPFLPRVARESFYPTTTAHRFLAANLGGERLASSDLVMAPGTSTYYGFRALTSNGFYPPTWAEALVEVDHDAFTTSPLFPILDASQSVAESPILDRLAVKYLAVRPDAPVFGNPVPPQEASGGLVWLETGRPVRAPTSAGRVRAVTLQVAERSDRSRSRTLAVRVYDRTGALVAAGVRTFEAPLSPFLTIAVPEPVARTAARAIEVVLRSGPPLAVAGASGSVPLVSAVRAGSDSLRLAFADGVLLYERLDALPRIRWAGTAEVIEDEAHRLVALGEPATVGSVILSTTGPPGSGAGARLRVERDDGDELSLRVDAEGSGYVVVADAMQDGWIVTVDGEEAVLRHAEHAGVAVLVAEGSHHVILRYDPPGWRLGLLISASSLVIYAAVAAMAAIVPRRRSQHALSGTEGAPP